MARHPSRRTVIVAALVVIAASAAVVVWLQRKQSPTRSQAAFCQSIDQASGLFTSLDPVDLASQLGALEHATAVAPPEIEPQVDSVTKLSRQLVVALSPHTTGSDGSVAPASPTDLGAAVDQVVAQANTQQVAADSEAVQAYAQAHCSLVLDPTRSTVVEAPGPTGTGADAGSN